MPKTSTSGQGRKAGSLNKHTAELKEMILGALDAAGGIDYLKRQASESPAAFLTLIGKVLPTTLQGTGKDGAIAVEDVTDTRMPIVDMIAAALAKSAMETTDDVSPTQH